MNHFVKKCDMCVSGMYASNRAPKTISTAIRPVADADVALIPYPEPRSLAEQLGAALSQASARAAAPVALPRLLRQLAPLLALPAGTPLLLPSLLVEIR